MAILTEDDIYRTSTQFKLWSFTRETLASLRSSTNSLAADGVRAATRKLQSHKAPASPGEDDGDDAPTHVEQKIDCLTVEEEQKLVGFYCIKAMQFADFCDFPTNVKATAVQYLKRFYLSNSPMTYHPKEILPSAFFLSTKTENHYTSLRSFVSKLPKTTAEDVIAPEFLLTQGLRFTFDVRHPQRGLEGGFMELMALAMGKGYTISGDERTPGQLKEDMFGLGPATEGGRKSKTTEDGIQRIQAAHGKAKETLKTSALLTDAYFLYTPSQMWLAAFMIADEPLTHFYIDTKFPTPSPLKPKILNTLRSCGQLLLSSPSAHPGESEMKELMKIDKKLYKCRNPEKMDLVSINKAKKRDGGGNSENGLDEQTAKKRKLEREKSEREADDMFGPPVGKRDGK